MTDTTDDMERSSDAVYDHFDKLEREASKVALASVSQPVKTSSILSRIVSGPQGETMRVLLYGTEGIGKTTWAANAPAPIFIQTRGESMPASVMDRPRIPANTFDDIMQAVDELRKLEHGYKTLVIDSITGLEVLIQNHLKTEHGWQTIEEPGYGKGFNMAVEKLNLLLSQLEMLQRERTMNIILLGHSLVKTFNNPDGDNYDRYQLQCNDKFAGPLKTWPQEVLFTKLDVITKKSSAKAKAKAIGEPGRVVFTRKMAAYDAKNQHALPESLPLEWSEFEKAWKAGNQPNMPARPETVAFIMESWPLVPDYEAKTPATLKWLGIKAMTEDELKKVSEPLLLQLQDRICQVVTKEGE